MKKNDMVKKVFFTGLTILSSFTNANSLSVAPLNAIPLSCISMSNQKCKARSEIVDVNSNNPIFYPFSIKKVNVVAIVIILMIHMQESVFLML